MLFISDYPNEETIKDGMLQRVKAVDTHFESEPRIYLNISFRNNIKKTTFRPDTHLTIINCNFFYHYTFIFLLLSRQSRIYCHSAYNALFYVLYFCFFRRKVKLIWDVHGIISEELKMSGSTFKSNIYQKLEAFLCKESDIILVVSNKMKRYLEDHYRINKASKTILYTIIPDNILNSDIDKEATVTARKEREKINIIYSGNTQSWQNIDLMMETIKKYNTQEYEFYFLTREPNSMTEYLKKYQLDTCTNIFVDSVSPVQLKTYYEKAHYGFILRDNITVNNVACPTKMIEYLYYGITPIVKWAEIGDFKELGYEYVYYDELNKLSRPTNNHNIEIAQAFIARNRAIDLKKVIYG